MPESAPTTRLLRRRSSTLARFAFAAMLAMAGGVAQAQVSKDLCKLLQPADFAAAGVAGAGPPSWNLDDDGAYCVYAGKSAATGGIELDIFVAKDESIAAEIWGNARPPAVARRDVLSEFPGAGAAEMGTVRDPSPYTSVTLRRGRLLIVLGVPAGPRAEAAAISLARLALQRAGSLGS